MAISPGSATPLEGDRFELPAVSAYFNMGRVVRRTFSVIGNNLLTFALLSLLVAIPFGLVNWREATLPAGIMRGGRFNLYSDGYFVISQIIYFVCLSLLEAAIIHATIVYLNGRKANPLESLKIAAAVVLQLIVITILWIAGIAVAFVVPFLGFMLLATWFVVVPVCVVERTGVIKAFGRSRQLTKGHRWAIFGLTLAYLLFFIVISVTIAGLGGVLPDSSEDLDVTLPPTFVGAILSLLVSMITSVLSSTLVASIYYELRMLKDGIGPEALAAVFD